jgi:CHAT domain
MIEVSVSPAYLVEGRDTDLDVIFTNTTASACRNLVFKLSFPPEIRLLRGNELIQLPLIDAGEITSRKVRICADVVGRWRLNTANFSYRDSYDMTVRVPSVVIEVTVGAVTPAEGSSGMDLLVEVDRSELPSNEWATIICYLENTSETELLDVCVTMDGPIDVRGRDVPQRVGTLDPAERRHVVFHVRAPDGGPRVLLDVTTTYTGDGEVQIRRTESMVLKRVQRRIWRAGDKEGVKSRTRILYLAANPRGTARLRSEQEFRDIAAALERAQFRDRFVLVPSFAARVMDISRDVIRHSPQIIHFAGHGETSGSLFAEDGLGDAAPVDRDTVVDLVRLADGVRCVIINACDTYKLAEALISHVDYVVGMRYEISDKAAIEFSVGFYQAIAENRSIDTAFDSGRAVLRAYSQSIRERESPFLLKRG